MNKRFSAHECDDVTGADCNMGFEGTFGLAVTANADFAFEDHFGGETAAFDETGAEQPDIKPETHVVRHDLKFTGSQTNLYPLSRLSRPQAPRMANLQPAEALYV